MEKKTRSSLSIDALNDDCLKHIFSYLNIKDVFKIERVCKRWQEISKIAKKKIIVCGADTIHLKKILKKSGDDIINLTIINFHTISDFLNGIYLSEAHTALVWIEKYCKNLLHLSFEHEETFIPAELNNFPFLYKLRSLNLNSLPQKFNTSTNKIGEKFFFNEFKRFLELSDDLENFSYKNIDKKISIKNLGKDVELCEFKDQDISFQEIFKKFPVVKNLILKHVPYIISKGVLQVISKHLVSLEIIGNVHDSTKGFLCPEVEFGNLKKLAFDSSSLNDNIVMAIIDKSPLIEDVTLYNVGGQISQKGFRYLKNAGALARLNLRTPSLTGETLEFIAANCKMLQEINCIYLHLNIINLKNLVEYLPDLRYISVREIKDMSKECIASVLRTVRQRKNGVKLVLQFCGTYEEAVKLALIELKDSNSESHDFDLTVIIRQLDLAGRERFSRFISLYG